MYVRKCDFSQNIANTVTVQNILTSLANQFSDATATNDLYNKVQTSMSQTQEGALATVSDAISNFFSSLGEFALAFLGESVSGHPGAQGCLKMFENRRGKCIIFQNFLLVLMKCHPLIV